MAKGQEVGNKLDPGEVFEYLNGLAYPAKKEQIIECARSHGADRNIIRVLTDIEDREYKGPNDLGSALGG